MAQNVLEHFTVDSDNTRVAVISFSTSATVDINDLEPGEQTDAETKCTLYARLDRLVSGHTPYGYTATHEALQLATQVSTRPASQRLMISVQFYHGTHGINRGCGHSVRPSVVNCRFC